ncbi:restriction endonuclease subunit S [Acinetobacter sp. WCHA29]|uniref:restriction endonuclease subunit S n=1 Tax=Acinetobacter sp. WCHA29 TaxID=2004649 RepID=UPI000B3CC0BA|nr:restriction endonuclease subunit S [Acinetobacter sp. WCHA29]
MSEWVAVKLGDHVNLLTGFPFKSKEYTDSDEDIKLLRGDNVAQGYLRWENVKRWKLTSDPREQNYFLKVNDVILAMDRPWIEAGLKYSIVSNQDLPCLLVQRVACLRAKETLDQQFLRYVVGSKNFTEYVCSIETGTAVPHISGQQIKDYEFALPSLPEQKAIASVLSSLDDKIDLLHRQNKTLEAMAETLFRQWFIEEAKEDWEEKTIGDIFTIKGGGTPSTKEPSYWDGSIAWTSPRDLSTAKSLYMFSTERTITELGLTKVSSGLLPVGTLLMSSRAPIGYLALTDIEVAVNQGYIAILKHDLYSNEFMYLWCKANMELIKNSGNGSVFQEISKASFRELPFVCPPESLLKRFNGYCINWFSKIKLNAKQIQTLENLRDTLLPKLMSGEVRVQYQTEEVA